MNELLFLVHSVVISICTIIALKISKETLVTAIALFCVLANLFVIKQINLFGLHPTASDAFSVGAIVGLNLLQEYYGKQEAKKAIWTCFFALMFYVIASQIHNAYIPSVYDTSAVHFNYILTFMPRIVLASISVTLIVQFFDRFLYNFLKQKFEGKRFVLRNLISLFVVQLVDTVLFTFAGLYGIVEHPLDIILVSFGVKIITILISVPIIGVFAKNRRNNIFSQKNVN